MGRLASSNAEDLRGQAGNLRARHHQLQQREDDLRKRLRAARYSEIEELVIGGEGIRPTDAARQVRDDEDEHGWLPGPIEHGVLCSLSDSEVRELYTSNETVPAPDERELTNAQPSLAELIDPTGFRMAAGERDDALDCNTGKHRSEFWDDHAGSDVSADRLGELLQELDGIKSMLADGEPWLREVLFAGWTGGGQRRMWDDLAGVADRLVGDAAGTMSMIAERDVKLPPQRVRRKESRASSRRIVQRPARRRKARVRQDAYEAKLAKGDRREPDIRARTQGSGGLRNASRRCRTPAEENPVHCSLEPSDERCQGSLD